MPKPAEPGGMAGGRPPKLNDDRALRIVEAIRGGNTRATAAALGGIGTRTLHQWLAQGAPDNETGEYPDTEHGHLRHAVDVADAECEADMVKTWRIAAFGHEDADGIFQPGDWKAALEFLQRKNPAEWARVDRSKVELTGADGGPVEVDVSTAKSTLLAGIERLVPKPEADDA